MTTAGAVPVYSAQERRSRIVSIMAASSGNLVEWFDFYVFAFCSIYFAPSFFPKADPTVQLLNTAGVFAAGFLMRPIGGWFFGRIADRYGRKKSLVTSVIMMCAGSLLIAALPGYNSIGVWAPALLLLARMFQGLSVGGEYGATATYMSEIAMSGQRGFLSSFQYVTLVGGQLLAVLVVVALQQIFTEVELKEWAWRLAFVMGSLTALIAFFLRKGLRETLAQENFNSERAGNILLLFREHKRAFFTVVGYTAAGSLSFYTFTTYMQKFLVNTSHFSITTASHVMTGCLLFFAAVQPLFGALSDRIGRRNNMLLFSGLGVFCTVPVMLLLQGSDNPWISFGVITFALAIVSFYTSVAAIVKAELFPAEVRAIGVGLSYAVANAIFGGTAELIALSFKAGGYENGYYYYVTVMLAFAFLTSLSLPRQPRYLLKDEA
jgi:MHS family alpha-ketoglutarate permease-like MFS transporter